MNHPTLKIIQCSGSPYEIGLAHGRGAAPAIHDNVIAYTSFFDQTAKLSWPQARFKASKFIPTLQEKYPEILDEMKGIADGAAGGLIMEDILTLNVRSEICLTNLTDGCTCIGQRNGQTGEMFLAQNWDWMEEVKDGLVFLSITPKDSPLTMKFFSEAGIVGKIGINSAGLGLCMNAICSPEFDGAALPVHVMNRRILQFASTFDEAHAIVNTFGLASTVNYMVADRAGEFGNLECSPHGNVVIPPTSAAGHTFAVHTNHLCVLTKPNGPEDNPEDNTFSRLHRMVELTADGENISFDGIRTRLADRHGAPVGICRDKPPGGKGMEGLATLSTVIMELTAGTARITIGKPCDELPVLEVHI